MSRYKDELIGMEDAGAEDAFVEHDTNGYDDYDSTATQRTEFDVYVDLTYDDWF